MGNVNNQAAVSSTSIVTASRVYRPAAPAKPKPSVILWVLHARGDNGTRPVRVWAQNETHAAAQAQLHLGLQPGHEFYLDYQDMDDGRWIRCPVARIGHRAYDPITKAFGRIISAPKSSHGHFSVRWDDGTVSHQNTLYTVAVSETHPRDEGDSPHWLDWWNYRGEVTSISHL